MPVLISQFFRRYRTPLAIATFFLVMQLSSWPPLRFWGWWGGGNFLDSWQVLTSADCYRSIGLEVYEINNPCMTYVYGRPLLWTLSGLHIGASQTSLVGIIFLIIISLTIALLIKNLDFAPSRKAMVALLIAASPPVLLLADRGNFDSLILSMVLVAAWLHARGKSIIAIFLIFLSATIKYYTLPLLLLMVFVSKRITSKTVAAVLTLVSLLSILRDLKITQFNFATSDPHLTFGLGHEFLYLLEYNSLKWLESFSTAGGVVLVVFFFGVSFYWLKKETIDIDSSENKTFARNLYAFSTTIIMSCYFTGANADYRLIFLCISGITFISIIRISESFHSLAIHVIFGILWLTFPSGEFEIFGDLLLSVYVGFSIALIMKLIIEKKSLFLFK